MAMKGRRKRNPDGRMSLGEHLVEFRKRLLISVAAILVAVVAGWYLSTWVWDMLRRPIMDLKLEGRDAIITYGDISGGFDTKVQISLFIAVLIASPVWLYQVWAFLAPGLTKREKLFGVAFIGASVPLFLGGAFAGWLVLPNIVRLLSTFQPSEDAFYLQARTYLDFAIKLLLAVGVGFVMPVLLVMLNFIGVLRGASILKSWRIALLVIVLFAAIATPAADLTSMFLLAAPMVVLYFAAAGVALLHDRRVDKRRAAELDEYDLDDSSDPASPTKAKG
ncbi:twin-arginine translocase subunit TatC [Leucobacter sp. CSA2]|uniref:Sec-independent protein translocase protein TatC n=1 Tax=Leucobacter edaphi TaxID=2796472 RepID=A0A934QCP1_9MICO|nr:twin-arginine translocase subunit TatC [Leucobacter edaphi]MBK0421405.1 twin-arginine translocase subunit TatC [Leucobacter edaphi]